MSSSKKETGQSSHQRESSSYKRSNLEKKAEELLRKAGFNSFEIEYRFCKRFWRFDFAWPEHKVALEVEGGVWKGKRGGHTSGMGYSKDCEKYNEAAVRGWKVIRVTNLHLKEEKLEEWIGAVVPRTLEDDPFPVAEPDVVI